MNRDGRADTLRGILLIIMIIDHFGGQLSRYTYQPLGYVSAAEGFFFLSGFVCFEVYGRGGADRRTGAIRALKRGLKIYRYHLAVIILLPLLSFLVPQYAGYWQNYLGTYYSHPIACSLFAALLIYQPTHMDILPMYVLFLCALPVAVYLFHSGKGILVIIGTVMVWSLGQAINPNHFVERIMGFDIEKGYFNVLSWQIVFACGFIASFYKRELTKLTGKTGIMITLAIIALSFFILRHSESSLGQWMLAERGEFHIHRFINFVALIGLSFYVLRHIPKSFSLPFVAYLGRRSLLVFSSHIVLLYLSLPLGWRISEMLGPECFSLFEVLIIGGLGLTAHLWDRVREVAAFRRHERHRSIPVADDQIAKGTKLPTIHSAMEI